MKITFYNSLTNSLETFNPRHEGKVSMYVCGPTVYNYPHIGNMRPVVVFDTLRRFLSYVGYDVTYVSNFTDVDDKIIKAAQNEGKSEKELTEFYIQEFKNVTRLIGSDIPTITPKVTEYIQKIIDYVAKLVELGAAYVVDGDVYFRVSKIKDYGALSGINTDDLIAGARVEENSKKESPLDFALWKTTNVGINWESPWGRGRPGWHTECCVMIDTIFPDHFIDIHGGGYDLKFPHHENEIAQAEAMHGNKIAHYWMHNAFINFGNEKMSKSLGNVIYAKDMINQYGGPVTRLVILSAHYRQPVNFTEDTVKAATQEINKMQMAYKQMALKLQTSGIDLKEGNPAYIEGFINALADDLNTANALAELYNVLKEANQIIRSKEPDLAKLNDLFKTLTDMFHVLGLDINYVALSEEDKKLYENYLEAKANKNFDESDKIRQIFIEKGIM
ncbi:MAG: cysteine--tRNA ligase [Bacilli bacterium]|nr:cysteine--tRNA ligase [Bacilli bacterium]